MEGKLASASPPPVSIQEIEEIEPSLASTPLDLAPQDTEIGIEVHMTFDLKVDDYAKFIREFRALLVKNENPEMVAGHLVLGKQLPRREPKRWMYVKLVVGENGKTTTLAIRDDNLYLIGFQGKEGKWYEFGLSKGVTGSMMPKKDTTFLKCDVSYVQLLDVKEDEDFVKNMVKVELGKRYVISAVDLLSSYEQVDGVVDKGTKMALVCLIHVFCEATRMIPFFNTVVSCWDDTTVIHRIKVDDVKYIRNWGNMSGALREWKEESYGTWDTEVTTNLQGNDIVKSAGEALDVVEVLLRKFRKRYRPAKKQENGNDGNELGGDAANNGGNNDGDTDTGGNEQGGDAANNGGNNQGGDGDTDNGGNDQGGDGDTCNDGQKQTGEPAAGNNEQVLPVLPGGQQLVEVFTVRANSRVVGTITVCDGKRVQIIYKYDGPITTNESSSEGMLDLPLHGPYRSISADGSFGIQVDSLDKPNNPGGDMFWDCYSDKAEYYDKFLTQDIGSIAKVSYAVLSNAVETSVQVQLKLSAAGVAVAAAVAAAGVRVRVHGEITAHYEHYSDHRILLFSCTKHKDTELEVPTSTCEGYVYVPVPLQRAVIAVPVGLSLKINVNIHVALPPNHDKDIPVCGHLVLTLEGQKRAKIMEDDVDVEVTIGRPTSLSIGVFPTSPLLALATSPAQRKENRRKRMMRWITGRNKRLMRSITAGKKRLTRWITAGKKSLMRFVVKNRFYSRICHIKVA